MLTQSTQLCVAIGLHPKSQIGEVYAHAEATQVLQLRRGLHPFEPCVYILAQGECRKPVDFPPKVCSMYLTLSDHFLRVVVFEVSGTIYDVKNVSLALKWLSY